MAEMPVCSISPGENITVFWKSNWKCIWDFNISNWNLVIKIIFLFLINQSFELNFFRSKFQIIYLRVSQIEIIRPSPGIQFILFRDLEILLISMKLFDEFFLIIINLESKKIDRSHSINICLVEQLIDNFLGLPSLLHTSCLNIFQLLRSNGILLLNYSKNAKD